MILLLIVLAWIVVLSLIVGLCAASRAGDLQAQSPAPAERAWVQPTLWLPGADREIVAYTAGFSERPTEPVAALMRSDGMAA
jgi:hypothetical protein